MDPNTIRECISSEGVYWTENSDIGQHVKQFTDHGLPYDSSEGLDLVKYSVFRRPVSER